MTLGRPLVGVGILLCGVDGRVLLGHRIKDGEAASWCLPGGHLEAGESFEQAALRELLEETGTTKATATIFAVVVDKTGSGVTAGVVAEAHDLSPQVTEPHIFDRWEWARLDDLPQPLFPASQVLLDTWRGRPAPPGWFVYRVAATSATADRQSDATRLEETEP
jgi:8-oxo-dGTP pyrophosphatase MutT (NUDIX family)